MKRPLVLALAAAAMLFGATAANAARVDWSVGINLPAIGVAVGPAYAAPGYAPAYYPPVYATPPAYYAPQPRVWVPPLPPLPPLPRLAWFGHGGEHGYDRGNNRGHDHGHDRGHYDQHVVWRR